MRLPLLASMVVLLLLSTGCLGGDDAPEGDADATPTAPTTEADEAAPEAAAAESVALSFFERPGVGVPPTTMGISPATLSMDAGKAYLLVLSNDGQAPHDLVIEGLEVDTDTFAPGETLEVPLTPGEAGEYAYYCSVGGDGPAGHRAQGMRGTLTVA